MLGVLKQLGGIPPSSLGARGGRRQGEEAGWARWAGSPRRQVSGFGPFSLFLFCFLLLIDWASRNNYLAYL